MPKSDIELESILTVQLTASERSHGVAYVSAAIAPKGTILEFPHTTIDVPWDAQVAFVDEEPAANWGHACRYVLLNRETGEALSRPARFPPFQKSGTTDWRIAYRAPEVPNGVLLIPNS